jgi:hypothetical protein
VAGVLGCRVRTVQELGEQARRLHEEETALQQLAEHEGMGARRTGRCDVPHVARRLCARGVERDTRGELCHRLIHLRDGQELGLVDRAAVDVGAGEPDRGRALEVGVADELDDGVGLLLGVQEIPRAGVIAPPRADGGERDPAREN